MVGLPVARNLLFGLKTAQRTGPDTSGKNGFSRVVARSHTTIEPSTPTDARIAPSGRNESDLTVPDSAQQCVLRRNLLALFTIFK